MAVDLFNMASFTANGQIKQSCYRNTQFSKKGKKTKSCVGFWLCWLRIPSPPCPRLQWPSHRFFRTRMTEKVVFFMWQTNLYRNNSQRFNVIVEAWECWKWTQNLLLRMNKKIPERRRFLLSKRRSERKSNIYSRAEVYPQCMHSNMYLMHNKNREGDSGRRGREKRSVKNGNNDDKNEYTQKSVRTWLFNASTTFASQINVLDIFFVAVRRCTHLWRIQFLVYLVILVIFLDSSVVSLSRQPRTHLHILLFHLLYLSGRSFALSDTTDYVSALSRVYFHIRFKFWFRSHEMSFSLRLNYIRSQLERISTLSLSTSIQCSAHVFNTTAMCVYGMRYQPKVQTVICTAENVWLMYLDRWRNFFHLRTGAASHSKCKCTALFSRFFFCDLSGRMVFL